MTDESVETQSKKNAAKVGLVVVHGIGNQKHGKLAFKIAKSLVAEEEGTGEQLIKPSKSGASPMSILAGNIKILVDEAYWASLSHPDNRPRVILAKDLVSDYFQLITSAWNNSEISRAFRGNSFNRIKNMSMVSLGIIGLILSLFASMIFSEPSEPNIWFTAAIAAAIFSYVFFHTKRSLRYRWLRDRHLNLYKRISLFILWMPLAYFSSFLYLIAPFSKPHHVNFS
jgi:hypothetical protein